MQVRVLQLQRSTATGLASPAQEEAHDIRSVCAVVCERALLIVGAKMMFNTLAQCLARAFLFPLESGGATVMQKILPVIVSSVLSLHLLVDLISPAAFLCTPCFLIPLQTV